jgi:signal transduction histidine kinase
MKTSLMKREKCTADKYIKSKKALFHVKRIHIKKILGHLRDEISPVLEKRHIQWSEPHKIPAIMADEMAITRAFRNLIDNALKHGGPNLSKLMIGYRKDKDFHIFSVTNDGVGIQKRDAEMVFEMFRRPSASEKTEGSGLGLTIVKEIMEAHQGKAWLEPGPNKETTFFISISKALRA